MQLYIERDTSAQPLLNKDGNDYLKIQAGRYINNIEYRYLPDYVIDALDDSQRDDIENHKVYVIYICRVYYKLDSCDVIPDKTHKYFK